MSINSYLGNILGMNPVEHRDTCYDVKNKEVKAQTTGGVVYLPASWIGKKVRVLLLEPLEEER